MALHHSSVDAHLPADSCIKANLSELCQLAGLCLNAVRSTLLLLSKAALNVNSSPKKSDLEAPWEHTASREVPKAGSLPRARELLLLFEKWQGSWQGGPQDH